MNKLVYSTDPTTVLSIKAKGPTLKRKLRKPKSWYRRRLKPPKLEQHSDYHRIWRVVDGAVRDTLTKHPEYLATKHVHDAKFSFVKRITGAIIGAGYGVREDRLVSTGQRIRGTHRPQRQNGGAQEASQEASNRAGSGDEIEAVEKT
jgi:hypothetical protein